MGSACRRGSRKDRPLRQAACEHIYPILSQRRASGWNDALVRAISGAVVVSKTQAGQEMIAMRTGVVGFLLTHTEGRGGNDRPQQALHLTSHHILAGGAGILAANRL